MMAGKRETLRELRGASDGTPGTRGCSGGASLPTKPDEYDPRKKMACTMDEVEMFCVCTVPLRPPQPTHTPPPHPPPEDNVH